MSQQGREEINMNEFIPPKLFHVRIVRVGVVHLIIGLVTIAVGVMDISFSSVAFDIFPTAKVCTGVWVGAVILTTGIVGVLQSRSELRKKTASIAFFIFSSLSWLLSIVMIGIAIGEIAESEFAEGQLETQERLTNNGTDCSNLTLAANLNIRCVATATFDQKLVSDGLLVALGYIESIAACYSVVTVFDIAKKGFGSRETGEIRMKERVSNPEVRVNAHFQEHPQREEIPKDTSSPNNEDLAEPQQKTTDNGAPTVENPPL